MVVRGERFTNRVEHGAGGLVPGELARSQRAFGGEAGAKIRIRNQPRKRRGDGRCISRLEKERGASCHAHQRLDA